MGTPHSPKLQHCWNLTIRLFSVKSKTLVVGGGLTPLQRCSQCILQPQPTGQEWYLYKSVWRIDSTLTGTTTTVQSGPGRNNNEELLHTPQFSNSPQMQFFVRRGFLLLFSGYSQLILRPTYRVPEIINRHDIFNSVIIYVIFFLLKKNHTFINKYCEYFSLYKLKLNNIGFIFLIEILLIFKTER